MIAFCLLQGWLKNSMNIYESLMEVKVLLLIFALQLLEMSVKYQRMLDQGFIKQETGPSHYFISVDHHHIKYVPSILI